MGGAEGVADLLQPGQVVDRGERVVHRGEPDAGLAGLVLGPVVTVQAELGVVGKVGAELEEERAEVGVNAVEVEVVDHSGGPHDPWIGLTGGGVAALLGAEHSGLLLCPADEHHPLGPPRRFEQLQLGVHHVVFALALDEVDPGHVGGLRERVDLIDESVADRGQRRGRGDRQPQVLLEVAHHSAHVLKSWLIHIAVQPIDALDLEDDMVGEDFGDGAGYLHHRLRSTGGQSRPTNRTDGSYTRDRSAGHGGSQPAGAPHQNRPATRLDGLAKEKTSGSSSGPAPLGRRSATFSSSSVEPRYDLLLGLAEHPRRRRMTHENPEATIGRPRRAQPYSVRHVWNRRVRGPEVGGGRRGRRAPPAGVPGLRLGGRLRRRATASSDWPSARASSPTWRRSCPTTRSR